MSAPHRPPTIPRYNGGEPFTRAAWGVRRISYITVVDDDDSVRESLHSLLRSTGHTVSLFASAEMFLQDTNHPDTDCLILDVRMPGMSGFELQRHLRERGMDVPTIFITALGDEDTRRRALAGGAAAVLVKPFSEELVLDALVAVSRRG